VNRLKSIFIAVYPLLLTAITVAALVQLYRQGVHFGWLGALLTALPMLGLLSRAMVLRDLPRTTAELPAISGLALAGGALAIYDGGLSGADWPQAAALSGLAGFMVYNLWYSRFGRQSSEILAVGAKLPAFKLQDENGKTVPSDSFFGAPAVLLFYRGNWCPLCMAQIKEIAGQYRRLAELGATVALISPQPQGHTRRLAARFEVPFRFLVDAGNRTAEQLGIAIDNGIPFGFQVLGYDSDTVMPTVIVTDATGTILLADQTDNYRVRPEPMTFIRVLEESTAD
jgi:peroxiredoxin|tara:strand:+ start:736 stop:1587 length:852 start_codon:yes stop_codon:yes gene_type:complete